MATAQPSPEEVKSLRKAADKAEADYLKAVQKLSKEFSLAKPSKVIRMALEDLKAVEKNKKFKVNMDRWVDSSSIDGTCYVCFGGAVLANRYHMKEFEGDEEQLIPVFNGQNIQADYRVSSLDDFRCGSYHLGLDRFSNSHETKQLSDKVDKLLLDDKFVEELVKLANKHVHYSEDAEKFKLCMTKLAEFFEKHGV